MPKRPRPNRVGDPDFDPASHEVEIARCGACDAPVRLVFGTADEGLLRAYHGEDLILVIPTQQVFKAAGEDADLAAALTAGLLHYLPEAVRRFHRRRA